MQCDHFPCMAVPLWSSATCGHPSHSRSSSALPPPSPAPEWCHLSGLACLGACSLPVSFVKLELTVSSSCGPLSYPGIAVLLFWPGGGGFPFDDPVPLLEELSRLSHHHLRLCSDVTRGLCVEGRCLERRKGRQGSGERVWAV